VVVVIEPGPFESFRLVFAQHAEGGAAFQAQRLDPFDHCADVNEVGILGLPPGGAHAVPRRPTFAGLFGLGQHVGHGHRLFGLDAGIVAGRLRAIGAVLGAAAGLDRQKARHLHPVGVEIPAVKGLGLHDQVVKRQPEQGLGLIAGPIVAEGGFGV